MQINIFQSQNSTPLESHLRCCEKSTQLSVEKHPLSYYRREVNFQRSLPLMSRHKFSIRVLAVDKYSNLPTQPKILGYFSLEAHQQSWKDIRGSIGAFKKFIHSLEAMIECFPGEPCCLYLIVVVSLSPHFGNSTESNLIYFRCIEDEKHSSYLFSPFFIVLVQVKCAVHIPLPESFSVGIRCI